MFTSHSPIGGRYKKEYYLEKYVRFSPFNVALGRFSWLKIPITITMGMTRRPLVLLSGVAFFSMAWDGLYITLGIFGAGDKISPVVMIACTVSGFILINTGVFFLRRYFAARKLSSVTDSTVFIIIRKFSIRLMPFKDETIPVKVPTRASRGNGLRGTALSLIVNLGCFF